MSDRIYAYGDSGRLLGWKPGVSSEWATQAEACHDSNDISRDIIEFGSTIYAADGGYDGSGSLRAWNFDGVWDTKATLADECTALAVHSGELYVGGGSGKLYHFNGVDALSAVTSSGEKIRCLLSNGSHIYGGTLGASDSEISGQLLRWNGTNAWDEVAPQLGGLPYVEHLVECDGNIYGLAGGNNDYGHLYQWNNSDSWVEVADGLGSDSVTDMKVFSGEIFALTGPTALYQWNKVDAWAKVADALVVGAESHEYGKDLVVADDNLYAAYYASPEAPQPQKISLARWNKVDAWVKENVPTAGNDYSTQGVVASDALPFIHVCSITEVVAFSETTPNVHLTGRIAEIIELADSIEFGLELMERFSLSDTWVVFNYTSYQNSVDNPHISTVRIAKIELAGVTLYFSDRVWGSN